jgi:AcrR family transcriptional regulator
MIVSNWSSPMAPQSRSQKTRAKILTSAHAVFVQFGYERATLAEIAEKADVHLQTLVRHFPTKAEIMAAIHTSTADRFEFFFLEQEGTALARWREFIKICSEGAPEIFVFPTDTYRFPVITPQGQESVHRMKELLATGIAEDMGVNPALDIRPVLIACMLTAGNAHIAQSWAGKRFKKAEFVESLVEVVDVAEELVAEHLGPKTKSRKKAS